MRKLSPLTRHARRLLGMTALAVLVATPALLAQQDVPFNAADAGKLFGIRHELHGQGAPGGVTFIDGVLYVADTQNGTVKAYGPNGLEIALPAADWRPGEAENESSPVFGLIPNMLSSAVVSIVDDGTTTDTTVVLVSDSSVARVLAFAVDGTHLFTMRLAWPEGQPDDGGRVAVINGMAMSPGSRFVFTPATDSLALQGIFAAGWAFDFGQQGAVLAYASSTPFPFDSNAAWFAPTPHAALTSNGTALEVFGVTFDSVGNLYAVDTVTSRLTVYGPAPDFSQLFTFGTPEDGGPSGFHEPYGMAYMQAGPFGPGRLLVADQLNNRIQAFEPDFDNASLKHVYTIEGFTIEQFDSAQPYALAVDAATGRIATSDSSGLGNNRSWILQTRNLVAYDVEVLGSSGTPVSTTCSGGDYQVQFKLTVPAGWPALTGVVPELFVAGELKAAQSGAVDLSAGQVYLFTYSLTAPGDQTNPVVDELTLVAGGTTSETVDVLQRSGRVLVSNCFIENDPPTVAVTDFSRTPQLSGWFAVNSPYPWEPLVVTLTAQDDTAVKEIVYDFAGANDIGRDYPPVAGPTAEVTIEEVGLTTVIFKALDDNNVWSAEQRHDVNVVMIEDRHDEEGQLVSFVAGPVTSGFIYTVTGLPSGISFNDATGVFSGRLSYDAARYYNVVVNESLGADTSSYYFHWNVADRPRPAPVATNHSRSTNEDTPLSSGVIGDPEGIALTAALVNGPLHGSLALQDDGSFLYTPEADFNGVDLFAYRVNDGAVDSNVATVTITVNPVNDAPSFTAGPSPAISEDAGPQNVTGWATAISAGPANEAGQGVTFVVTHTNMALFAAPPSIAPTGALMYQPAPNASGTAVVMVVAQDTGGTAGGGRDTSDPVTFTITVLPVNDAPVAQNDAYSAGTSNVFSVPAPGVLGNDSDIDSATLTASLVSGPSAGTLQLNANGSFTFTRSTPAAGNVAFTYQVSDGFLTSHATVTITLASSNAPPVCTAASAMPSVIWPVNHKPVDVRIRGVVDPDGNPVTIVFTSILQDEPMDGEGQGHTDQDADIERNGTRAWVRAERSGAGDGRVYLVRFTATDPAGASCTGEARVSVPHSPGSTAVLGGARWNSLTGAHVSGVVRPVAADDKVTVTKASKIIDVLDNDTAYGQALTVSIVKAPNKGQVIANANGTVTYKAPANANGSTSFTYQLTGSSGGTDTAVVTITFAKSSGRDHDDDEDCGDSGHDHGNDRDNRDRDHRHGKHDRCRHRR